MRDPILYIKDILAAVQSIETFVENMSFEQFHADDKTSSAVLRKFEIIDEAAKLMFLYTNDSNILPEGYRVLGRQFEVCAVAAVIEFIDTELVDIV